MVSKILHFLEENAEKIVLAIVGIACMYLLLSRVVFSPNKVSIDNLKFSPGAIDDYISKQAKELENKLRQPPESLESSEPRLPEFVSTLDSSVRGVDVAVWPVVPQAPVGGAGGTRNYRLPEIGVVFDTEIEHIRAVVYEPLEEITPDNTYDKNSGNEPNDIDLVTMQASFDIATLYDRFFECFAGDDVPLEWRDPCYAQPVFAAANLQRQELGEDGHWDEWIDVPRSKIDHRRNLFTIIEKVSDLPPGGLKVRILQYKPKETQIDLLQPSAYQIASAKEEWFPPLLHRDFLKLQAQEDLEAKRQERDEKLNANTSSRSTRLDSGNRRTSSTRGRGRDTGNTPASGDRSTRRGSRRTGNQSGAETGLYPDMGGTGSRRNRRSRTDQTDPAMMEQDMLLMQGLEISNKPSINNVYEKLDEISLFSDIDFSKLDELIFWAHDDSAEPRKTYRYRIRLGVFNPAAGPKSPDVILWSEFSRNSEPIHIPGRMYFFAMDAPETEKSVRVQVSKFLLGHWYSDDFRVKSGETIGELREMEKDRTSSGRLTNSLRRSGVSLLDKRSTEPEEIDYSTGAVLVDVATVEDWAAEPKMNARKFKDMLYSFDGAEIEHMGIGQKYWSTELKTAFGDIARAQRIPKEPFKPWDSTRRRRLPSIMDYGEGEMSPEMYEEMMMMQGMGNR